MSEFAESQIVYRDLAGPWGSMRLQVGGVDVTTFRGVPAQIGGYQLQEPYGYGPADFSFPQITSLEVDGWGTGALAWFGMGKEARLVQVDEAGTFVRIVWRGFVSSINPLPEGTNVHCDGYASGRLALIPHHPRLFNSVKNLGSWLYDAFLRAGLTMTPTFGLDTGIDLDPGREAGTELSYCDFLLSRSLKENGDLLTVVPSGTSFAQAWKDLSTVHFSAFNTGAGTRLDATRDLQEEPTTIWGQGREPATDDDEGTLVWVNRKDPGLKQGETPTFPGSMEYGDSGDDVDRLQRKLQGTGYLARRDTVGGFNEATEDAVRALQDDAKLSQTGVVNEATWDALFDVGDTGLSLKQSFIMPLAELTEVRKWIYAANGFRLDRNPEWDPTRPEVGLDWDFGVETKARARKIAKRHLERIHESPAWVGTLELAADVVVGDHGHGTAPEGIMSRLDITPGMNVNVRNFDDATVFHVSGVTVDSDLTVRCAVDTKGRDLLQVGAILDANAESRRNPARQWLRSHRGIDANRVFPEFSETGGEVFNRIDLVGGEWAVFPVVAGQSGSINRVRLALTGAKTEFVLALTAKRTYPGFWNKEVGNPFDVASPVRNIVVDDGGTGYTTAPTVTVSGGGGSGAKAVAVVEGGEVVEVNLTKKGNGFSSAPSVSFSGGGGSGASASASTGLTGGSKWASNLTEYIDDERALLVSWGDEEQPCGYFPGMKLDESTGEPTGDPVTGVMLDDGGIDYHTFNQPVIWFAVYPKLDCSIRPQRVLWPVLEAGT